MARPTSREKSAVARALIELRRRLGETQQSMAVRLGTTVTSVARWESMPDRQPNAVMLMNFWLLSREHGHRDLMKVLQQALHALEKAEQRKAEQWREQHERWMKLLRTAEALLELANQFAAENHPSAPKLLGLAMENAALAKAGWSGSWGNL